MSFCVSLPEATSKFIASLSLAISFVVFLVQGRYDFKARTQMVKDKIQTSDDLKFIKSGRMNMLIIVKDKEVTKIDCSSDAFLLNPLVTRSSTMDQVMFQPNVVFKLTVDFKRTFACVETAVRESTDWVLCSCGGGMAYFNKTEERLVLQQCVVSIQSTIDEMSKPFVAVLKLDDDEWVLERAIR